MNQLTAFFLFILLFACNLSSNTRPTIDALKSMEIAPENEVSIDMKALFELSPLSIFDETTEGLDLSEKNDLLKKGESISWKIVEESETKLVIRSKQPSSEVTFRFFKYKDNPDGVLLVEVVNQDHLNLLSWIYSSERNSLQEAEVLKKYTANDFVSKEDRLPDSFEAVLNYHFVDDQTIEVSPQTWMSEEFETRTIINRVFLKWNGETFEEQTSGKFSLLNQSGYDLSKLEHDGNIVHKRFWQDSNGENIALFTKKGREELFVYHYTVDSEGEKLLRKVTDAEKACDYDLTLEFIESALQITDLDNNNFGELTFAYKKACISDVSPLDLKLVMLEKGNAFTISGTTSIDQPGIKVEGSKNIDAAFENAPADFLSHANQLWESVNR